jgi:LCP family protein required for cell wall assembly
MHVQRQPMMVGRRQVRHMKRWQGCLLAALLIFLIGSLLCVASLAVYVLVPSEPFRLLILGLDSRDGEGFVTRTDSIMVVGIQPAHIGVLSIPRDLFITAPGYGLQRINTINVLGEMESAGTGAHLVSRSIDESFSVPINRYLRLDFQAFTALVDAIGGVSIDVPRRIIDYQFPTADYGTMVVEFQPGWQHMDGDTALIYARTRHADDDYGRAGRQQQVLQAVALKLLNPLYWVPAFVSLQTHVDTNLTMLDMITLIPPLMVNFNDFNMQVINRDYIRPGNGYSVPDYARLQPWIDEYLR